MPPQPAKMSTPCSSATLSIRRGRRWCGYTLVTRVLFRNSCSLAILRQQWPWRLSTIGMSGSASCLLNSTTYSHPAASGVEERFYSWEALKCRNEGTRHDRGSGYKSCFGLRSVTFVAGGAMLCVLLLIQAKRPGHSCASQRLSPLHLLVLFWLSIKTFFCPRE